MFVLPCWLDELMLVSPAMRRELLLERQRHCRRHRLGARAGQARLHLDGGEVDGRQVATPAACRYAIAPNTRMPSMMQRRRDRPLDEELRKVHGVTLRLVTLDADPAAGHQAQLAVGHDGFGRLEAALDHRIQARRPLDDDRAVFDGRDPALTTKAYWPCWPTCTAAVGTTTAVGSVVSATLTLTNCPGQSRRSVVRERRLDPDRAGRLIDRCCRRT